MSVIGRLVRRAASWTAILVLAAIGAPALAQAPLSSAPASFDVAGRSVVLAVHGVGAQVYECKPQAGGANGWVFREPIATLVADGKTVGRHYAGPSWALTDGGLVKAAPQANAPGATPDDVPLLKLRVTAHPGEGPLAAAATVLRLNTRGGALAGPCATAGELRAVAYSADYLFLR